MRCSSNTPSGMTIVFGPAVNSACMKAARMVQTPSLVAQMPLLREASGRSSVQLTTNQPGWIAIDGSAPTPPLGQPGSAVGVGVPGRGVGVGVGVGDGVGLGVGVGVGSTKPGAPGSTITPLTARSSSPRSPSTKCITRLPSAETSESNWYQ